MPTWLKNWLRKPALARMERDLDARLAERKAKRPARSHAALKGHRTRRAHNFN